MKKRLLCVVVIVALICTVFCACTGKTDNGKVSMYELKNTMAAASQNLGEMTYASSEDPNPEEIFENISSMDYSKVDSFFVYYATNGTGNADEIAVIQVKKSEDLTEARKELEQHVSKRIALYSTYDKSQIKKLEGAKVEADGNCVALIICDDAAKVSDAFHTFFNKG